MGQERKLCKCEEPEYWEDVKGNRTNICKRCGGRLDEPKPNWRDKGQTFIRMEAAVAELNISPEEQELLWELLCRKAKAWVKHSYKAGCLNASTKN